MCQKYLLSANSKWQHLGEWGINSWQGEGYARLSGNALLPAFSFSVRKMLTLPHGFNLENAEDLNFWASVLGSSAGVINGGNPSQCHAILRANACKQLYFTMVHVFQLYHVSPYQQLCWIGSDSTPSGLSATSTYQRKQKQRWNALACSIVLGVKCLKNYMHICTWKWICIQTCKASGMCHVSPTVCNCYIILCDCGSIFIPLL